MKEELSLQHHLETSAKTGQNIATLFERITKHLYLKNLESIDNDDLREKEDDVKQ